MPTPHSPRPFWNKPETRALLRKRQAMIFKRTDRLDQHQRHEDEDIDRHDQIIVKEELTNCERTT